MNTRPDYGNLIDLEEKALNEGEDHWTITGYGSIFNNVDLGKDVVVPGAFSKSLRERGLPLLLFNHKMEDAPIGTVVDAKEDKRGLWFKAELPKDDSFVAGRIVPQLKKRGLRGTSIGYKCTDKETRKTDGARLLKQIDLYEISVVNLAMNPLATVEHIKGIVPYQDLPLDKDAKAWDAKAAFQKIRAKMGDNPEDLKSAFLFADVEKPVEQWDLRFLIADLDDSGGMKANHLAVLKASAAVFGGGDVLPQGAEEAVGESLDRYFQRLNLQSPSKSWSVTEFQAQDESEREARLRGLGVSRDLAKMMLKGLREADRPSTLREAGSPSEDAQTLLAAFAELVAQTRKR